MYKLKILIEGYARSEDNGVYHASPTTSLVYNDKVKILVDPGTNGKLLKEAFRKEGIAFTDIDMIFLTHYHPDHFLNLRFFPTIDLYDGETRWHEDEEHAYGPNYLAEGIEILKTPGHTMEQASLLFDTEEYGKVCICQDVFWWEDGKQKSEIYDDLINNPDPFMVDWEKLQESRKLVLEKADWIVPGHGKMFKNPIKK